VSEILIFASLLLIPFLGLVLALMQRRAPAEEEGRPPIEAIGDVEDAERYGYRR
jgi:hypothetical protein